MRLLIFHNKIYETIEQVCAEKSMRPQAVQDILSIPSEHFRYLTEEESTGYRQTLSTIKSTDSINNAICKIQPTAGTYSIVKGQVVIGNGTNWINVTTGQIVLEDDDMQQHFDVTYKATNVNSKRLLNEIVNLMDNISNEFIIRNRTTSQPRFEYAAVADFLDAYFDELQTQNVVTVYDIIADFRNNNGKDTHRGIIKVDISFKQFNCLNVTKINFTLKAKP